MKLSLRGKLFISLLSAFAFLLVVSLYSSTSDENTVNAITTSDGFVFESGVITGYEGTSSVINIPATISGQAVTAINGAFNRNHTITQVTIPEGVTQIKGEAFFWCENLQSISIPSTVTIIESGSIANNPELSSIILNELNTSFILGEDNVLYNADQTEIIQHICVSDTTTYTVPETVTTIHNYAFSYSSNLTTVEIPAETTTIGEGVFHSCPKLTSISVDAANTNYESDSGVLVSKDGKTLLAYPANKSGSSYSTSNSITTFSELAFAGCQNLTTLTLGSSANNVMLGLYISSSLQRVEVNASNATYSSLDGVLASKDGTSIYYYPNGRTETEYIVPSGVTTIGTMSFALHSHIQSIVLHEGVSAIQSMAVIGCENLAKIVIPASKTEFGLIALMGSDSLKIWGYAESDAENYANFYGIPFVAMGKSSDWTYTDNENGTCDITAYLGSSTDVNVPSVIDGLWVSTVTCTTFDEHSEIEYITFYESVSTLEVANSDGSIYLFEDCLSLREIYFSASLNTFETNGAPNKPFKGCLALVNILVDEDNTSFYDNNGVLFANDKTLINYPNGRTSSTYSIPEGTTDILYSAFDNVYLKNITIPGSVLTLRKGSEPTFKDTLETVYISEGVETVEDVFSETAPLDISFPNSVTTVLGFADGDIHTFYVYENSAAHLYAEAHNIKYVFLCIVTFETNGGVSTKTQIVPVGSKVTKPTDVSREGYILQGWFADEALTDEWTFSTDKVSSSMTLYAKWAEGYAIIYHMNGGTNDSRNPDYYLAGKTLYLKEPTKANYTFDGWYTDSSCKLKYKFEAILKTTTGPVELWADWWVITKPSDDDNTGGSINKSALSDERHPEISYSNFPKSIDYMQVGQMITITGRIDIKYAEVNDISAEYSGYTEKLYKYQDGKKRISYFKYSHTFDLDEINYDSSDEYRIKIYLTDDSYYYHTIPIYKYKLITEVVNAPSSNLYMNSDKTYELRTMAIASDSFTVLNATYKSLTPEICKVDGKKLVPLARGNGQVETSIKLEDGSTFSCIDEFNVNEKTVSEPSELERELMCQCHGKYCSGLPEGGIDPVLLDLIEKIREECDVPVYIIDGYRCPKYSLLIGADKDSEHVYGRAADIWAKDMTMDELYEICDRLNENGGVGKYETHIHIDTRGVYIRWED